MARFEINTAELAGMGLQAAAADVYFQMGVDHSVGRRGDIDRVAAHMWFNLAAARGNGEAARWRSDISKEMSAAEIAEAQRQAREWIRRH